MRIYCAHRPLCVCMDDTGLRVVRERVRGLARLDREDTQRVLQALRILDKTGGDGMRRFSPKRLWREECTECHGPIATRHQYRTCSEACEAQAIAALDTW